MAHTTVMYEGGPRSGRWLGVAVAVGLHVMVLAALWQLEPVRSALRSATLMVDLVEIKPPPPPQTPPQPLPSRPRVQPPPRPAPPPPVLTAPPQAPAIQVAPAAPSVQLPSIESPPPAPPAPVAVAPPAPQALAGAPEPVTPPSFNAAYLSNPSPAYPPASRRMGEEGKVILRVHVTEQGTADEVQVRTSSGFTRLDAVALETVRQWKFVPARRGSSPVAAWVLVPISFSLRS